MKMGFKSNRAPTTSSRRFPGESISASDWDLATSLSETDPTYRRTFVVRHGRLHRLPDGFLMMAPTQLWPLAVTPLLSPFGKLRAAMEYFIPPRADQEGDESMAGFVRRRLGREVFERLVEPLVSAVYAADMEKARRSAHASPFSGYGTRTRQFDSGRCGTR